MKSQKNPLHTVRLLVCLVMLTSLMVSGCVSGIGGTSVRPSNPANALIFDAEKATENKEFKKALAHYEQFLKEYPTHRLVPKALLGMGTVYNMTGDHTKATRTFKDLMEKYPRSAEYEPANLGLCKSYYDSGKTGEGFACIEKAGKEFRSSRSRADLAVLYAEFLAKADRGKEAIEHLDTALQQLSHTYQPQLLEAMISVTKSMNPGDIEVLIPGARWQEPAATLTLAWGLRLADTRQYQKAESVLKNFLESFTNHKKKALAQETLAAIKDKDEVDRMALGGLLPLSGRFAVLGNESMRGVKMAMAIYAEKPGALPIRVRIEDTLSQDAATVTALQRLTDDLVMAAIGPIGSSPQALRSSASSGIPLITFTQQVGVTDAGTNVFRNFMTPAMQVDRLVSYLIKTKGISRFAILYPQDAYGELFRDLFWDRVVAAGGEITGVEGYELKTTDFSEPIQKLAGSHSRYKRPESSEESAPSGMQFEALFIPDSADRAGVILPQLAYHDIENVQIVGTNLWHSPKLLEMGRTHAVGAIMPSGLFTESRRPQVQQFVEKYMETYHDTPNYLEAVVFDSMMLLFNIMEQAPRNREDLKKLLLEMPPYPGVTGYIHFSASREAETLPYLLKVTDSGFTEINP